MQAVDLTIQAGGAVGATPQADFERGGLKVIEEAGAALILHYSSLAFISDPPQTHAEIPAPAAKVWLRLWLIMRLLIRWNGRTVPIKPHRIQPVCRS
ncbi:MAG: hypothetical protein H6667_26025 [Ardenticatenaceae bacterium]|nr:hypothetical protein [Ardenticatenaceae bacterium]